MPTEIAALEDIPEGGSIRRDVGGLEIALFRIDGQVYAINAACPHRRGPLDGGELEEKFIVVCPWHGWRFDVRTGKSPTHPGQVASHALAISDGKVFM